MVEVEGWAWGPFGTSAAFTWLSMQKQQEADDRETLERGWLEEKFRQVSFARRQSEGAGDQGRELKERVAGETGACATL